MIGTFLSSDQVIFSLVYFWFSSHHHNKHFSHCCCCCCDYFSSCHHRTLCSSFTLHDCAGDHSLHLRAGIHHLWQRQLHLCWYSFSSTPNQPLRTCDDYYNVSVWNMNSLFVPCVSDIDECELFHNGQAGRLCLHACVNTPGGYRCSCPAGYDVTRDGRSCKGPFIIFAFIKPGSKTTPWVERVTKKGISNQWHHWCLMRSCHGCKNNRNLIIVVYS